MTEQKTLDPQNIILYGPPGTGKTYATRSLALNLIEGTDPFAERPSSEQDVAAFEKFRLTGQIEFVTFHQSYGYEDFIHGIRPSLDRTPSTPQLEYELRPGVFREIAARALGQTPFSAPSHASEGPSRPHSETRSGARYTLTQDNARRLWETVLNSGEAAPETLTTAQVNEVVKGQALQFVVAALQHVYHLYLKTPSADFDQIWTRLLENIDGSRNGRLLFKEEATPKRWYLARSADSSIRQQEFSAETIETTPDPRYVPMGGLPHVLIIDEINRGNISKIFGELITLLEPDKRIGQENELRLRLPYSGPNDPPFGIPSNLHIIGTMNTADRSIAHMDVALRRRFTFHELMPRSDVVQTFLDKNGAIEEVRDLLVDILDKINERVRFLYDRDHQIGHSYFLRVKTWVDLRNVFGDRVIPLLQEYFHNDWGKICIVLGCPYDLDGKPSGQASNVAAIKNYRAPIIGASTLSETVTVGFDHDDYEDKLDYKVNPEFLTSNDGELEPFFSGILERTII